ncbi:MAG: hypothetical protein RLZZ301_1418 [Bacteroidota bacterium]|jgi:murein L,D-transpeptidase YcbB/YkuD
MMHRVWLLIFAISLFACTSKPAKQQHSYLFNPKKESAEKLRTLLQNGHPQLQLSNEARQQLYSFYSKNRFQALFTTEKTLNTTGLKVLSTFQQPEQFGIPKKRLLPLIKGAHPLLHEVVLSYNLGVVKHDLDSGFIDWTRKKLKPKTWDAQAFDWVTNKEILDTFLVNCGPKDSMYVFFAQQLYQYVQNAPIDTVSYELLTEKENAEKAWGLLKKALIAQNRIPTNSDSLSIRMALRSYQKEKGLNPDGRIGTATVMAFAESNHERLLRACLSLDRLRQQAKEPRTFICVNLPAFELRYVADDTLRAIHRIIIGKQDHASPELESVLTRIVSLPFWKVPSSIADNEMLPAVKRNANYLQKEHLRIYKGLNKEADPKMVNWKRINGKHFPYTLIQDPGPWNSLGLIKFEFANAYSVYIHDTPSRSLFNQAFRCFSHGCMRCENPVELAKLILERDQRNDQFNKVTPDSLQVLITKNIHQSIPLRSGIPIFVRYQSVTADRNGLYFHYDVYGRESTLLAALNSNK